jgi:hypothetical protein
MWPASSSAVTGVDRDHLADEADVDRLAVHDGLRAGGGHQAAVLTGEADRPAAVLVDQADHLGPDLTDEDHPDDVDRLLGGHPQPAAELAGDTQSGEHRGDLRAAAVHDDREDAAGAEEDHVLGEGAPARVVDHGVAAVLDHHDVAVELLEPRQRAGEDGDLLRIALGVVRAHDPARADLLRQLPLGRGLVDPDVGGRRVLRAESVLVALREVFGHVEYAEFSWT